LNTPAWEANSSRSLAEVQALNLDKEPRGSDEFEMKDNPDVGQDLRERVHRLRATIGDGIGKGKGTQECTFLSTILNTVIEGPGRASPYRDSPPSPPPRRSKARPTSGAYELPLDTDTRAQEDFESQRLPVRKRQLWTPDDITPPTSSYDDPSIIASVQAQTPRTQQLQYKSRKRSQYGVNGQLQTEEESDARSPGRSKPIPKPDREVTKGVDGRYVCTWIGCTEEVRTFARKCEWSKHMDMHDRPYKCPVDDCEKLPGFTYTGAWLRHQRKVHNLHGGEAFPDSIMQWY
jgi:hypothetical protein